MKKIILVTSLYRLRKHNACLSRYAHLVEKLGPKWGDKKPINLLDILDHNGTDDCLWALCTAVRHPDGDRVMRLVMCDFAETVLPIFEKEYPDDKRPANAIKVARRYANGKATDEAWLAARSAASRLRGWLRGRYKPRSYANIWGDKTPCRQIKAAKGRERRIRDTD